MDALREFIRNRFPHLYLFIFKLKKFMTSRGTKTIINNRGKMIGVKYDIIGSGNYIYIASGAVLSNFTIYIRGNNNRIHIHEKCVIGGEGWLYSRGGVRFETSNSELVIGKKTAIVSANFFLLEPSQKIHIGEKCIMSWGVEVRASDAHSIFDVNSGIRVNVGKDIVVGNHVWIGRGVTILKGCNISNDVIIALNSVVTKDVLQNFVIVAGCPATIIREEVNWCDFELNASS